MPERKPKRAEHNTRVFVDPSGIGGGIPAPMSTLNDDYHDEPTEPENSDRVPEPDPPGLAHRVVEWLRGRSKS